MTLIAMILTVQLSESLDRWSIRCTSARLQKVRGGSAGWSRNRSHTNDQYRQRHCQQHQGQRTSRTQPNGAWNKRTTTTKQEREFQDT